MIDEHNPDIICGCESHNDSSYFNAEIFPTINRVKGAGSVFLCIRENLDVSEEPELNVAAEIIWAKVSLSKRSPIYICSFYRPPDLSTDLIVQLGSSLNILIRRFISLTNDPYSKTVEQNWIDLKNAIDTVSINATLLKELDLRMIGKYIVVLKTP